MVVPRRYGWTLKTMLVLLAIGLGADVANWMLASAGFGNQAGRLLVGMVCALSACRMPPKVGDGFLQWRVAAWEAQAIVAPPMLAEALFASALPFWWAVAAVLGAYVMAIGVAAWRLDRWVRQWSHDQAHNEAEHQRGKRDADGGADGYVGGG